MMVRYARQAWWPCTGRTCPVMVVFQESYTKGVASRSKSIWRIVPKGGRGAPAPGQARQVQDGGALVSPSPFFMRVGYYINFYEVSSHLSELTEILCEEQFYSLL
jgi:hypothetical protein